VTADGFPIVVLSRLLGTRIRRTTGADLLEPVCREARKNGLPIFMLARRPSRAPGIPIAPPVGGRAD
jgi:UDP-N-acetyl-D-mannosaminuronic acid transferase (WecB/TagA/CpsF family)